MDLAGGSLIFLGFLVVFLLAIAYGYYSRRGSGIEQRPHRKTHSTMGKDPAADVKNWGRGQN